MICCLFSGDKYVYIFGIYIDCSVCESVSELICSEFFVTFLTNVCITNQFTSQLHCLINRSF